MTNWTLLPLAPPPSPTPPPSPVPINPTVTVTVTAPPPPPSQVSVADLPPEVSDRLNYLDNLNRLPAHIDNLWERFVESPPALASSFAALVAVVAILVSACMVRKQIQTSTGLVKQQIKAARDKDVEVTKRAAVIDAVDALQQLFDALVDIDYARREATKPGIGFTRREKKPDLDLAAYETAFAGSRRALNKLRLFELDRDLIVEYDRVRDAASEFVHGARDRSHPGLKVFSARRRALNTRLGLLVKLDLDAVGANKPASGQVQADVTTNSARTVNTP